MTVQDVTAFSTFIPYGGPITHSSTGSKPDSLVHPGWKSYSSHLTSYEIHGPPAQWPISGIRRNTYSHCPESFSHFVSSIEWLPARTKHPMIPPYFALNIFLSFNSRVTPATFLDVIDQIVDLAEVGSPWMPTLYSFVSTMKFPNKGCRLHHDDWSIGMKTSA